MNTQHCGCWWSGANAQDHKYQQCITLDQFHRKLWHLQLTTLFSWSNSEKNLPVCLRVNSLALRSECDSKNVIFNLVLLIGILRSSHDSALRWIPQDLTDDKSTLVQVMAWRRQATSHYLSQCWLSSLSPYGVARLQWVNTACNSTVWHIHKPTILSLFLSTSILHAIRAKITLVANHSYKWSLTTSDSIDKIVFLGSPFAVTTKQPNGSRRPCMCM